MANVYVLQRQMFLDNSSGTNIGVRVEIEWIPDSVDAAPDIAYVNVASPKASNKAQWRSAFQSAVNAWATAQGHVVQKLIYLDFDAA